MAEATLYDRCSVLRLHGMPIWLRCFTSPVGLRFNLYHGYAPPVLSGATWEQAELVIGVLEKVHASQQKAAA